MVLMDDDGFRISIESDPVPKGSPTAIRDQNSYVAHRKGIRPMINMIVLVDAERPFMVVPTSIVDGDDEIVVSVVDVMIELQVLLFIEENVDNGDDNALFENRCNWEECMT